MIDNPQLSRFDEPNTEEADSLLANLSIEKAETFMPSDNTDKWIEVTGCGLREGFVGVDADFTIDYSGADKGSLSIESRGPAKLDLCCAYSELLPELLLDYYV